MLDDEDESPEEEEFEDLSFDEEESGEEEELDESWLEESEEESPEEEEEESFVEEEVEEEEAPREMTSLNNVPLTVRIEAGHLRMKASELLQLQPGNLLTLPQKEEPLVDLVVQGQCIGQGELIRVGEVIGVRILHLSSATPKK